MDPVKIGIAVVAVLIVLLLAISGDWTIPIRAFRRWRIARKRTFLLKATAREYAEIIMCPSWRQKKKSQVGKDRLVQELRNRENWSIFKSGESIPIPSAEEVRHQGLRTISQRRSLIRYGGRFFVCIVEYHRIRYQKESAQKIYWMTDSPSQFSKAELEVIAGQFRTQARKVRGWLEGFLVLALVITGGLSLLLIPSIGNWLGVVTLPPSLLYGTRFVGGLVFRDALAVLGTIMLMVFGITGWFYMKLRRLDTQRRKYVV
jgi:hypothetical protein